MIINTILFLLSFILVFISSYLLTSIISEKNSPLGIMYIPLIAFAQVVGTFEILSLFSLIKVPFVLLSNILCTLVSVHIWKKQNKPVYYIEKQYILDILSKIKNSFKLDKTLIVLGICFTVFLVTSIVLSFIMPVTSGDGKTYHVARSFFFIINGNLNHFITNDIRALCLPINSEILYSWVILFFKKDLFLAYFSFAGYLLSMFAVFNIMGLLKFSYRRRFWVIFILSSFSSVIVQASSTETDIIISALVTSAIYMFWTGLKKDKKIPIFMAALSYALAIGTKTPSIIMIPAIGFLMLTLCIYYKKYKALVSFLGYGVINFIIFSSYNYILNFIDYKNISGPDFFMVVSKNYYGIKGACANFIKYIFMFFDFTGFKWPDYIMGDLVGIKDNVLKFFGLSYYPDGLYSTNVYFQRTLIEQCMGAGVLGFLVFLPCWIISLFKGITKKRMCKLIFIFAVVMLINLIIISYLLAYMTYSVRFLMSFMVISSPILAYSYFSNKNPLKYIIIYFSIYYLAFVSTHIWVRPIGKIIKYVRTNNATIQMVRQIAVCSDFLDFDEPKVDCKVRKHIKKYSTDTKILYIPDSATNYVGLGKLILEGYQIELGEPELLTFSNKDFTQYDLIIMPVERQRATMIKDYENRKNDCVVDARKEYAKVINKNREYPCFYEYNKNIPIYDKNGKPEKPYAVTCNIQPNFIINKGFSVARLVGSVSMAPDNLVSNYYMFYQNKNKKPKVVNN